MIYVLATIPHTEAYVFALAQAFVKPHHRRMLVAHARMPDLTAGVGELAASIGAPGHSYVNLHCGALGHRISDLLGLHPPVYEKGPLWTAALAEGKRMGPYRKWYWRLYPEVRMAIEELGWTAA